MRCPKCTGPVTRKDMLAPLAWTSFVCPACKAHLDASRLSSSLIILVVGLVSAGLAWVLSVLGVGGILSMLVGAIALLAGIPVGMGVFARLIVHPTEHPSVAS